MPEEKLPAPGQILNGNTSTLPSPNAVLNAPARSSGTDYSLIIGSDTDTDQLENTLNDIKKTARGTILDSEIDILRDVLKNPSTTPEQAREAVQTIQGYHPKYEDGEATSYYLKKEDNGVLVPKPLAKGERPPRGYDVASVWNNPKQAKGDSWYTDLGKSLFNGVIGAAAGTGELLNLGYTAITGDESANINSAVNALESLQFQKDEDLKKPIYNTEGIDQWADLLDKDRFDISPQTLWGTLNMTAESVAGFLTGAGVASKYAKGITGAEKLGKTGVNASAFTGSFLSQLGDNMDAARDAGLEGRDVAAFASAVTAAQAAIDAKFGILPNIFKGAAQKAEKELLKEFARQAEKTATGELTKEGFKQAVKGTVLAYDKTLAEMVAQGVINVGKEGLQEVGQDFVERAGEQLYDKLSDEEKAKFGTNALDPKSFGSYMQNLAAGLFGGAFMAPASVSSKYDKQSLNAFEIVEGGKDKIDEFKANVYAAQRRGELTEQERDQAVFKIDQYNKYWEQTKDMPNMSLDDKRKAFELSFNIEGLKNEINIPVEDIEKLDPIALAKIDNKKSLIKELQKELNHILLKQDIQTETIVPEKTVEKVAKDEGIEKTDREGRKRPPTLEELVKEIGEPISTPAEEIEVEEESPEQSPKLTNRRYAYDRESTPDFDAKDDKGNYEFNKLTDPISKQRAIRNYLDANPQLENELEGYIVQGQNNVWQVDIGDGRYVQFGKSIKPEEFVGETENFPEEFEMYQDSDGRELKRYKEPVIVKLESIGEGDKRKRFLNVYNSKTGKYIWSIKERQKGATKGGGKQYTEEEIAQMQDIQKRGYTPSNRRQVKSFASKVADGTLESTPENLQFYENNKEAVESELSSMLADQQLPPLTQQEAETEFAKLAAQEEYEFYYANLPENYTGIILYHGTPHSFEGFDINKIGTGEGAQAFGHGLYFTNKVDIAKGYANVLGSKKKFWEALINGNTISLTQEDFDFIKNELDDLGFDGSIAENNNVEEIIVDGKSEYSPSTLEALAVLFGKNSEQELEGYDLSKEQVDRLYSIKKKISDPQLYKVAIHEGKDPFQYDYLDWDESLTSSQKEKINVNYDAKTGKDLYQYLTKELGGQKQASEFLLSKGIDGITYKSDRGTGGKSGDGRNFVVFDPKSIRVLGVNNQDQIQFQKQSDRKGDFQKVIDRIKKSMPKVNVVIDENIPGAGHVQGNTLKINPNYAGADTPIHEAGHILIDSIGFKNRVIQAGINQLRNTPLWAEIAERYSDLNEEMLAKEVLAEAIGREGADIFDTEVAKSKFRQVLDYIFDKLKQLFGIDKNVAKSLARQIISGIGTKNLKGTNKTVQESRRKEPESNDELAQKVIDKLRETEDLSAIPYEKLTDYYNAIASAEDLKGRTRYLNEIMKRMALNMKERQLTQSKGSRSAAASKDIGWFDKWFKVLSHFGDAFPELKEFNKLWNSAFFTKMKEARNEKNTHDKLAIDVINERNKKLGIKESAVEILSKLALNRNHKYFDFLDNGKGKFTSLNEANAKGLSEAQKKYLAYARELVAKRKELSKDMDIYNVDMDILKLDKGFSEAWQSDGFTAALGTMFGGGNNLFKTEIVFTNPNTGKEQTATFGQIQKILSEYANKGLKEQAKASAMMLKYGIRAKRQLKQDIDNGKVSVGSSDYVTLDENGNLRSKFGDDRDPNRNYSKDFYNVLNEFIDDSMHIKHISPLVPIINSIEYLNKNKIYGPNDEILHREKKNVSEWLDKWIKLHILQKPEENDPRLDKALKLLRFTTSAIGMWFNVPANILNVAIGNYNNWRDQDGKVWLKGQQRLFGGKNRKYGVLNKYAHDIIKKYVAVSNDTDSSPFLKTGFGKFAELGYLGQKWGEFQIQGSGLLGLMSEEDYNSFEYKKNKYGVDELTVKPGVDEKALEERILKHIDTVSDVQGKYSAKDRMNILNNEIGKIALQYKIWIPAWFQTRFKNDGSYRVAWRNLWKDGFKELRTDLKNGNFAKVGKNKAFMQNLKGAMTVGLLLALVYNDDEDKKKSQASKMLNRALSDVLFIFDPHNLKFTITRPVAATGTIEKFINTLEHLFTMDEYKSDSKYGDKGDLKVQGDIISLTPGRQLIDLASEEE